MSTFKRWATRTALAVPVGLMSASVFAAGESDAALAAINGSLSQSSIFGWAVIGVLAGLMVFKFIKRLL